MNAIQNLSLPAQAVVVSMLPGYVMENQTVLMEVMKQEIVPVAKTNFYVPMALCVYQKLICAITSTTVPTTVMKHMLIVHVILPPNLNVKEEDA